MTNGTIALFRHMIASEKLPTFPVHAVLRRVILLARSAAQETLQPPPNIGSMTTSTSPFPKEASSASRIVRCSPSTKISM